jgi:hypothetical protein
MKHRSKTPTRSAAPVGNPLYATLFRTIHRSLRPPVHKQLL